ncbi:MAG: hypothetical protein ABI232_00555 [Jatrophihabitantaceae bacterium]
MGAPPPPSPVSVRGGSAGIEARHDSMVVAARSFGHVATDAGGALIALHGYLLDPGLYTSALLDPAGAAAFEATFLDGLDGPDGLTFAAAAAAALDAELRAAALAYEGADKLDVAYNDNVGGLGPLLIEAPATLYDMIRQDRWSDAQQILTRDPGLVDNLVNDRTLGQVALVTGLLGLLYPDGRAVLTVLGPDTRSAATAAPRSLAQVMAGLALRDQGEDGEIDVKILTSADGRRHVIVDIPGTKSWGSPGSNSHITSLATNLRAIGGQPTSYERGVLDAMRAAGVRPDDQVMLVGHSEGGMVAVDTARDAVRSGSYDITHVVTAGSPIGLTAGALPKQVQLLAIENDDDIVPHLDGATNPDKVNITTVSVHHGDGTIGGDHSLDRSYVPGAADIDASGNTSIRDFLSSANGFLQPAHVDTQTYVITRAN